jgi:serine phosphatase RsbU (regulator of sigma subunit)
VAISKVAARFDIRENSEASEPLRAVGPEGAGLVCPLCFGGTLVGTIAVGRRVGDFPLGRLQDEVIRTFAEFLAIQTLNISRQRKEVRNRVVARELEIAKDIQHLLLPRTLPQLAGFGLAGGLQSAREVGGDFYDAIALADGSLLLMIADVMGKGVPAALFATTMRGLLLGLAERSSDPAQLLSGLNRLLYKELSSVAMFITAQIVHVDLKTQMLTAASAGHCPPLYIPTGSHSVSSMAMQGLPLGVLPDTVYPEMSARMGSPAVLLMYTDGLIDARNADGEAYGKRRLKSWLLSNSDPGTNAPEQRDRLVAELNRYRGDTAMDDDQAFLLLTEDRAAGTRAATPGGKRSRQSASPLLSPANS